MEKRNKQRKRKKSKPTLGLPREFKFDVAVGDRLTIPKRTIGQMTYELLVTNGFVKLYSFKGRAYWVAQVTVSEHKTPDWKLHFSVRGGFGEVARAWDALARVFVAMQCRSSMKAISPLNATWPDAMRGRELTVYIFRYDEAYGKGLPIRKPDGRWGRVDLRPADEHSEEFWAQFIRQAEAALDAAGVQPGPCADGDLPIGRFVSLRNEAYTYHHHGELMYPPNELGWNAAKQPLPFSRRFAFTLHAKSILLHFRQPAKLVLLILILGVALTIAIVTVMLMR
jgi:hypothetical protein